MKIAIYPGSFDPVTSGHLNIIRRGASIFDKLIVCVMVNAGKNPMFTLDERVELIRKVTKDLPNVEVDGSNELLADYAKRKGSCVIVKGLRAGSDFENEFTMAMINHKINPDLDTMFLTAAGTGVNNMGVVRVSLPYAAIVGGLSLVCYLAAGVLA